MNYKRKPLIAFILSLLSGIFIVLGSFLCLWMGSFWYWGWMDWMMHNWDSHMHFWDYGTSGFISTSIIGMVFGTIVIAAAVMLYSKPQQHILWGALILTFSVFSIVSCMGGMGIGLLLGIAGGILALIWKS